MRSREINEDRIKMLSCSMVANVRLEHDENLMEAVTAELGKRMGVEIAKKLREFNKIEFYEEDGKVYYRANLEIIVPPTPVRHNYNT